MGKVSLAVETQSSPLSAITTLAEVAPDWEPRFSIF
jgi:hypothetical protein